MLATALLSGGPGTIPAVPLTVLPKPADLPRTWTLAVPYLALAIFGAVPGCKRDDTRAEKSATTLVFGAYTTPREAYGNAILPAFRTQWLKKNGHDVSIRESYLASGAQSRAIQAGFEADVAALSLDPDIEKLRESGLVKHDWRQGPFGGMVTHSVVVIGVRKGNPKNIRGWSDLAKADVEVLTPNVRTSGGAMWNVLAIYGAALRDPANKADASAGAIAALGAILRNVKIMDRSGRDSMLTFERGIGDAIVTYENEILIGRKQGKTYDYVVPDATILIENPIAVVDQYAERHGANQLAKSFVDFLVTPEVQRQYAQHGLRPVLPSVAKEFSDQFPSAKDLFTVRDLGGWAAVQKTIFDAGGIYEKSFAQGNAQKP